MYPSLPQLLVTVLAAQFPAARVCTELPANLEQVLPAIQVARFGGGAPVVTMDRGYVDLDVWAADLDAAELLGSQVRAWMHLHLAGQSATGPTGTGVFAAVHEQTGMMQRPSGNPDVKRVGMVFTLHLHSH